MTVEQTAERLQVHPRTVRRLLVSGELPGNRIGRQWRVSSAALTAYVEGGTRKPAASAEAAPARRRRSGD